MLIDFKLRSLKRNLGFIQHYVLDYPEDML